MSANNKLWITTHTTWKTKAQMGG